VSRWFEAWRQDKPDWIRGAGRAGRRPKLDGAQFKVSFRQACVTPFS